MTIDMTTPSTEGTGAAVPLTVEQPPITALQPNPVNPRPIGAEEWEELLRGIGIELGSRIAVAVAIIRISLLHYIEACSSRNRSPEPYEVIEGSTRLLHTPDYTTVKWCDEVYHFTPMQAEVVRVLHNYQREGLDELRGAFILEKIESGSRSLSDLFKDSPAWKTLVLPGSKRGSYKLAS